MKGLVDTSTILRAALNKEFGLRTQNRISHVSVMEVPTHHKLIYMTDGAMNIAPTLDEKRQIIENSVKIAHAVGNEIPNVGIIGAVEKVNPQMEATLHAEELYVGDVFWNLRSDENIDVAYGVYVYVVEAPNIGTKIGKFALIK